MGRASLAAPARCLTPLQSCNPVVRRPEAWLRWRQISWLSPPPLPSLGMPSCWRRNPSTFEWVSPHPSLWSSRWLCPAGLAAEVTLRPPWKIKFCCAPRRFFCFPGDQSHPISLANRRQLFPACLAGLLLERLFSVGKTWISGEGQTALASPPLTT